MFFSVALLFILPLVAASYNATNIQALFGPSLSSGAEIFLPSYANYTEDVQQRWSAWAAPSYIAVIKVATAKDVQSIVKIATAQKIPFLATAAGHGTALTYGGLHDGIDIDLSNLRYAHLDAPNNLLTIGGGTKFQQIWDVLQGAGKEIQTGVAQCVGSLGATLGAGIGPLQGQHGLMLDALESVRLVTANGDLINVSNTENADLFWGIRGAGFNFGIVTEATYKVYEATYYGQVMEGDILFPASANRSIWEIIKSYDNTLPAKLSLTVAVSYNATLDESLIVVNTVYYGSKEEALPYLQPFLNLKTLQVNISMVPWNKLYTAVFFGTDVTSCLSNHHLNSAGQGLKQTDVATFESFFTDFTDFYRQHLEINGAFVATRYPNQAVLAVPDEETAYPYRDIKTHLFFENIYPNNSTLDNVVESFLITARNKFQQTSGYDNLTLYINYSHGDEGPGVWYSPRKLDRLTSLKRKWDPNQLFSWNSPLPLHWP
ncbi:fad binding domain protein [Lasallia pustulata]|uniref:Fad binding domain protein n=1 Tax=Lasallia pustulata TaxID=136370 RepID=A0A1W5D4X9_9LECA|nr:fad binding domain protein [Lasallia pustulata]